jgi:hypothetical protein
MSTLSHEIHCLQSPETKASKSTLMFCGLVGGESIDDARDEFFRNFSEDSKRNGVSYLMISRVVKA